MCTYLNLPLANQTKSTIDLHEGFSTTISLRFLEVTSFKHY